LLAAVVVDTVILAEVEVEALVDIEQELDFL
jgi:hypothetical protein